MRSAAQGVQPLVGRDVVVGVARAAMEGAGRQADASCEGVELTKAVRRQMAPATTVFRHIGIVDVYQFSPPKKNVTRPLSGMAAASIFGRAPAKKNAPDMPGRQSLVAVITPKLLLREEKQGSRQRRLQG
jgi:hypothetical protein